MFFKSGLYFFLNFIIIETVTGITDASIGYCTFYNIIKISKMYILRKCVSVAL